MRTSRLKGAMLGAVLLAVVPFPVGVAMAKMPPPPPPCPDYCPPSSCPSWCPVTVDDGGGQDSSPGTAEDGSTSGASGTTAAATEAGGDPGAYDQKGGGLESGTETTAMPGEVMMGSCGCDVVGRPFGASYGVAGLAFAALVVARRRDRRLTR